YMGASVLHEDAIYPAKVANIPINIRNTNRPGDPGTMITSEPKVDPNQIVSGIAGKRGFTVIGVYKSHLASEKGFIRKLAGIMEDNDITIEHLPTGIDTMSVVIDKKMLNGKLDEIVEQMQNQLKPDTLDVVEDMALIATVGAGMAARKGTSASLFTALADAGVNVRMIDQGSSEMNIIVGVEDKDFETAIKAIYKAFVK
ncbi:MAG: ACT domain-containing protein, partial [Clostridia bacterium]|nr:ACT domain-containing protein [Clostridia bacterium]